MSEQTFTNEQLNEKVRNPDSNRMVKLGSIITKKGQIRAKYARIGLFLSNGVLKQNLIVINKTTRNTYKIDRDSTTLAEPFSNINPKKIKIGKEFGDFIVVSEIPEDLSVNISFTIEYDFNYSSAPDTTIKHQQIVNGIFTVEQLSDKEFLIQQIVERNTQQLNLAEEDYGLRNIRVSGFLTTNEQELQLEKMVLRETAPLDITNIYNEDIPLLDGHCIHEFMKKTYPRHCKTENQMEKIRQIKTTEDIYGFCKKYHIKMLAYDINKNIIKANYPDLKKRYLKNCIFIAYCNHLYPIKNPSLHMSRPTKFIVNIIDNVHAELVKLLKSGRIPHYVHLLKTNMMYFSVIEKIDGIKTEVVFSCNHEYKLCKEILAKFGCEDRCYPATTLIRVPGILEELYHWDISSDGVTKTKKNSHSFIPSGKKITKEGYNHKNPDFDDGTPTEQIITMDTNNSYPAALWALTHLPVIDIKTDIPKKISDQNHRINPVYKYVVSVEERTILIDNNGEYYGNLLLLAKQNGIKFKLHEEIPVTTVDNYFKTMIEDMRERIDRKTFKDMMNAFIGKMEYKTESYDSYKYVKIMNDDERKTFDGKITEITDEYCIGYKKKENYTVLTRKPIADMIKDNVRIGLFNFIKELKLKRADIKQIKTDAITFKTDKDDFLKHINTELGGWKYETMSEMNQPIVLPKKIPSFIYDKSHNGRLITGYAGCGKTYDIVNNIIPDLYSSYRVLTPSHKALEEYRKNKCVCDVIQKYIMSHSIPEETTIIIDEIGMLNGAMWNMLYKCKIAGKTIIGYGDFNQLAPVSPGIHLTYDNPNFLNMMFREQTTNEMNHRNTFTKEYYDLLRSPEATRTIHMARRDAALLEHNTPWDEASIIIAYTNLTRQKYNKKMCEKHNITSLDTIGTKVICKTNSLSKYEIYNNFRFTVKEIDGDTISLISEQDFIYKIPLELFNRYGYFNYGYAITLYAVQGSSLKSFHYCMEDAGYLNGRALYTLISRLKTI